MRIKVYGRNLEIVRSDDKWTVFLLGPEGKKRAARDILIPSRLKENQVACYLEDLLHEWARPDNR